MMFKMLDTIFDFRKNKFFYDFSKFSPFVALYPGIKLHEIRLFAPLFTHRNAKLPSEKQVPQISEN